MLFRFSRIAALWSLLTLAVAAAAAEPPATVNDFLQQNCLDCHQGDAADAGLDLSAIDRDLSKPGTAERWVRIFDRVRDGEMPPADYGELDPKQATTFLESTSKWIAHAQQRQYAQLGRVQSRRLTNQQLERTLHDLLSIDVPLAVLMPEEPRTDGFANIAESQSMSHFHLESHLNVIDTALDAAFDRLLDRKEFWEQQYDARKLARANPNRRCRDPEMIDGKAVVWSSNMIFYGRITSTTVDQSGWYRVTFSASAMNKPDDHGVWCTVHSGACNSGAPLMTWIGSFEATDEPTQRTFEAWIPAGHMLEIRPGDTTLRQARFQGGQVGAGEGGPQNVPGVALHSMTMQRIYPGGDIDDVQESLFGDLAIRIDRKSNTIRYDGDDPIADTTAQLDRFAQRALRRPVDDAELEPYRQWLRQAIDDGQDPIEALRAGYRAILCSPRFLYFVEPTGPLDDHAIASRLSYMLTGSMPDQPLRKLAQQGRLRDPAVLRGEVDRLLAGERGQQFVKDFAAGWLDLVDINFTEPDRKLYRDFDPVVQNAMLDETHHFLCSLLSGNRSASELVDADFTFLNSRLARYYGIDGVDSEQVQRVSLPADSNRGGLLSQGAILKVTANGTNTSPVLRGVWVSERIMGTPIPPPPENVPAVEPDIRGATTIREQLQLHLSDISCAGCHQNIDPPGYALENFDAAGRWRDAYLKVEKGKQKKGIEIDAGFVMADGKTFDNFDSFRKLLAADEPRLARNFAGHLLVYGTGGPLHFADRAVLDQIVDQAADQGYGLRSLLYGVVTSPTFLTK